MTTLKENVMVSISIVIICLFLYFSISIVIDSDSDGYLDMTNDMNTICKSNGYTTYIYPSSGGLNSSNFRCQKIEYTYSKEYFKL